MGEIVLGNLIALFTTFKYLDIYYFDSIYSLAPRRAKA